MSNDLTALAEAVGVVKFAPPSTRLPQHSKKRVPCAQCGMNATQRVVWYSGRRGALCKECAGIRDLASHRGVKARG